MTRKPFAKLVALPPPCKKSHDWWVAPPDGPPPGVGRLPAVCITCWRTKAFPRHQMDLTMKEWNSAGHEEGIAHRYIKERETENEF